MPTNSDDTRLVTFLLIIIGAFVIFPMFFMGFGMMGFGPMAGGMWGGGMWGDGMWGSGMWGDGTMSGWMVVLGIVMQLLFLAAIIVGGYLVYRGLTGGEGESDHALDELRLAYARGDLTDEEYEQRREALERDTESQ